MPVFLKVIVDKSVSSLKVSMARLDTYLDTDDVSTAGRRGRTVEMLERTEDVTVSLKSDDVTVGDEGLPSSGIKLNFYFLVEACNGVVNVSFERLVN